MKVKGWKTAKDAEELIMAGAKAYEEMDVKPKTA